MINVHIVEDNPIVRRGLSQYLNKTASIKVIDQTQDYAETISSVQSNHPDIVILDVFLQSNTFGLWLAEKLKQCCPNLKIIIFSSIKMPLLISKFIEIGVSAFISKGVSFEEIESIVRKVHQGQNHIPHKLIKTLNSGLQSQDQAFKLSSTEVSLFYYLKKLDSIKQVARIFSLTERELYEYVSRLFFALNISEISELGFLNEIYDISITDIKERV